MPDMSIVRKHEKLVRCQIELRKSIQIHNDGLIQLPQNTIINTSRGVTLKASICVGLHTFINHNSNVHSEFDNSTFWTWRAQISWVLIRLFKWWKPYSNNKCFYIFGKFIAIASVEKRIHNYCLLHVALLISYEPKHISRVWPKFRFSITWTIHL